MLLTSIIQFYFVQNILGQQEALEKVNRLLSSMFQESKRKVRNKQTQKGREKISTNPTVLFDQISPSTLVDSSETTQKVSLL